MGAAGTKGSHALAPITLYVNAQNGRITKLTTLENGVGSVAWSPDERAIAYLSRSIVSASSSLAISNVIDHSRKEQGREIYAGHSSWLAWDADRHRIIFLSEGIGKDRRQTGIYALSEDGGEPLRLTAAEVTSISAANAP